jgi:hypothetical protein
VRAFAERARRALTESEADGIRSDLETAAQADELEPRVRLALSDEWLAQRAYDRAAALLAAADSLAPDSLTDYYVDPGDWTAALFAQHASTRSRPARTSVARNWPGAVLARLQDRPLRQQVSASLRRAVRAAGDLTAAHRVLDDEFRRRPKPCEPPPPSRSRRPSSRRSSPPLRTSPIA